jgi:DHA1 family bicyclomycin/chloramphenicol resistance-like MFS transporter
MNNFILIILLAAFPPLSTDMYLPAISTLCTIWGITLVGMFFSIGALLILGKATPTNFALSMFAYSLFLGMGRPISNHMILKQVRQDTGTASSLLTFFNFLCGAIAMELISLD